MLKAKIKHKFRHSTKNNKNFISKTNNSSNKFNRSNHILSGASIYSKNRSNGNVVDHTIAKLCRRGTGTILLCVRSRS